MAKIVLSSRVSKDEYTDYVENAFDLSVGDVSTVEIPMNFSLERLGQWNVGVICGASGSGKSQILNRLGGGMTAKFDNSKSVISNFENMSPKDAADILCAMGLSSVPTWIRPYSVLSNGEKYRAEMAWIIAHASDEEIVRMDEFTSVVDRNVAKSMSNALQRYVRSKGKRVILATCHYDILEWLQPDWIYDLNKGGVLERGDCLRRGRPSISLRVYRTEPDTWRIFAKHHYITADMNEGAACYCFEWDDKLVGFCSVLANPGKGLENAWRISRLVVLPDFQGLGLGRHIAEFIGGIYKENGGKMYIKTVNPRLGHYFERSRLWSPTGYNGRTRGISESDAKRYANRLTRASYCYAYVGPVVNGYAKLRDPIERLRREKSLEGQLSLF